MRRPMQSLATFPGGMPDTGHSGRANNEEDLLDPYGGGDVPGPYGNVNDPYDGDWALAPLGGKARHLSNLRMVMPQQRPMMQRRMAPMSRLVAQPDWQPHPQFAQPRQFERSQYEGVKYAPRENYNIINDNAGVDNAGKGTNAAFLGSNGGGFGLKQRTAGAAKLARSAKVAPKARKVTKGAAANKAAAHARKTVLNPQPSTHNPQIHFIIVMIRWTGLAPTLTHEAQSRWASRWPCARTSRCSTAPTTPTRPSTASRATTSSTTVPPPPPPRPPQRPAGVSGSASRLLRGPQHPRQRSHSSIHPRDRILRGQQMPLSRHKWTTLRYRERFHPGACGTTDDQTPPGQRVVAFHPPPRVSQWWACGEGGSQAGPRSCGRRADGRPSPHV